MQKIIPHLWFDKEARRPRGSTPRCSRTPRSEHPSPCGTPPAAMPQTVSFTIAGYEFMAISAGPFFTFNPSVSFMLNFDPSMMEDAEQQAPAAWEALSEGGSVLMPLQEVPVQPALRLDAGPVRRLLAADPDRPRRRGPAVHRAVADVRRRPSAAGPRRRPTSTSTCSRTRGEAHSRATARARNPTGGHGQLHRLHARGPVVRCDGQRPGARSSPSTRRSR